MLYNADPHVGKTIGIYKILNVCDYTGKDGCKLYHMQCIFCGWENDTKLSNISGDTKKCTHVNVNGSYKLFNSYQWDNKLLKGIFHGMKDRCYNIKSKDYDTYGGKGIRICDEWLDNPKLFEMWAVYSGYEDGLTIDRINPNKNYCPENCRWVTLADNAKYKSTTRLINVDGEVHTGKDWAKILKLGENVINTYVRKYGLNNTVEFIRKYNQSPKLPRRCNQSYYDVYMQ